jgi:hypothetical protein
LRHKHVLWAECRDVIAGGTCSNHYDVKNPTASRSWYRVKSLQDTSVSSCEVQDPHHVRTSWQFPCRQYASPVTVCSLPFFLVFVCLFYSSFVSPSQLMTEHRRIFILQQNKIALIHFNEAPLTLNSHSPSPPFTQYPTYSLSEFINCVARNVSKANRGNPLLTINLSVFY